MSLVPLHFQPATKLAVLIPNAVSTHSFSGPLVLPLTEPVLGSKLTLRVYSGFAGLDLAKTTNLLNASFSKAGKKLKPDYFKSPATTVYVAGDYEAIAIIKEVVGVPYLDKIARDPNYSSKGYGPILMAALKVAYPKLFWRSCVSNTAANALYDKVSEQSHEIGNWKVYGWGVNNFEFSKLVLGIVGLPENFITKVAAIA